METLVFNFHDDNNEFVGGLNLKSGSDAKHVQGMDITGSLKLYANHIEFLREVSKIHNAHF